MEPFREAVTFAVPFAVTAPAAAVKLPLLAPAGTVTDAGTLNSAELELRATAKGEGARPFTVTVQVAAACALKEAGAQATPVTVKEEIGGGLMAMLPPLAETVSTPPAGDAANAFPKPIATVPVAASESDIESVATTPLEIMVEFEPETRQVYPATVVVHDRDFPAAVVAGPAATLTLGTLEPGYVSVHCNPAGSLPAGELTAKFRDRVLPANALADETLIDD